MNALKITAAALLVLAASCTEYVDPLAYVDPKVATCGEPEADFWHQIPNFTPHANSRCHPGACVPFGMVSPGPTTRHFEDAPSGYSAHDTLLTGFTFMHTSGSGWDAEFGNLLTMPSNGPLNTCFGLNCKRLAEERKAGTDEALLMGFQSAFDPEGAEASAGYYSTLLKRYGIRTECTATPRCGAMRFTFPENELSRIQFDLAFRITGSSAHQEIEVLSDSTFAGHMRYTPLEGGWGNGRAGVYYDLYFYAELSRPMTSFGFWKADVPDGMSRCDVEVNSLDYIKLLTNSDVVREGRSFEGNCIGFFTEFPTVDGEQVELKVGFSFVDAEGARRNFDAEAAGLSFDGIHAAARKAWASELGKIRVQGGTEAQRTIFYTGLYHASLDPRVFSDVDGRFVGGDGKVHSCLGQGVESEAKGQGSPGADAAGEGDSAGYTRRTLFAGWDVFRSHMPLQTIINPSLVSDLLNSQIALAEESGRGYFNRWEMLNAYSGCMLGNPTNSVLVDAYSKGIRTYDAAKALRIAMKSSELPLEGLSVYPDDMACVSAALENAYFDWCTGRLAELMDSTAIAKEFYRRGQAYRDWFYPEAGWFFPKDAAGNWREITPDWPTRLFYGTCECNLQQQGWFVPHELDSIVELTGGREKAVARLDTLFSRTAFGEYGWSDWYCHGNEPVHWIPFIYNRLGEPSKTQYWVREILDKCYTADVEGMTGNDDEGQMSAWYVLAASGLHQACPGDGLVEIMSPLFKRVEFALDPAYYPGGRFTVITHGAGDPSKRYIRRVRLDGRELDARQIDFSAIAAGSTLELWLSRTPSATGGVAAK